MLRARLTNSTTVPSIAALPATPDNIAEIAYQAIEIEGWMPTVSGGSASFAAGASSRHPQLSDTVNLTRAIAFSSEQAGNGQSLGRQSTTRGMTSSAPELSATLSVPT